MKGAVPRGESTNNTKIATNKKVMKNEIKIKRQIRSDRVRDWKKAPVFIAITVLCTLSTVRHPALWVVWVFLANQFAALMVQIFQKSFLYSAIIKRILEANDFI